MPPASKPVSSWDTLDLIMSITKMMAKATIDSSDAASSFFQEPADHQPIFLGLPRETRLEILRYCLLTSRNRSTAWTISSLPIDEFQLRLGAIANIQVSLMSPISGRVISSENGLAAEEIRYELHPALLAVCRKLMHEGRYLLYNENRWLAIQCCKITTIHKVRASDFLENLGLKTRYKLKSGMLASLQTTLLSQEKPEIFRDYMPSMYARFENHDHASEVELLPYSDIDLLARAFYLSGFTIGPSSRLHLAERALRGRPHLVLPDLESSADLAHRLLPWAVRLSPRLSLNDSFTTSLKCQKGDIKDVLTRLYCFKAQSYPAFLCDVMETSLQEVEVLILKKKGLQTVVPTLSKILGQATDAFSHFTQLHLHGDCQPVARLFRIRIIAAWYLAGLDQKWFDYSDDTKESSIIACRRHQMLLALFIMRCLKIHAVPIKLADGGHIWRIQVDLLIARLSQGLRSWINAWLYFVRVVVMCERSKRPTGLSIEAKDIWARGEITEAYVRKMGGATGVYEITHFVVKNGFPTASFGDLIDAWAERRGYNAPLNISMRVEAKVVMDPATGELA